jgi:hypothetical protein
MAKPRKELTDLRPRVYSFPERPGKDGRAWSPPSDVQLRELALRHGFPLDFDLAHHLEDSWFWWRADMQAGKPPTAAARKEFLKELARRAESLADAVNKAGIVERRLIFDVIPPARLELDKIALDSHNLAQAAKVAVRRVRPSKKGARGDPDTIELLCRLWRIYRSAFGASARRVTRSGNQYSGRFFRFAEEVLRQFGVRRKSNMSLGKLIEKAQAAVGRREATKIIP